MAVYNAGEDWELTRERLLSGIVRRAFYGRSLGLNGLSSSTVDMTFLLHV